MVGWLVGWLAGWMVGWWVGWQTTRQNFPGLAVSEMHRLLQKGVYTLGALRFSSTSSGKGKPRTEHHREWKSPTFLDTFWEGFVESLILT